MARDVSVGIDIGTYQIKVMIAERLSSSNTLLDILGTGFSESRGLRYGYIVNKGDIVRGIKKAAGQAEEAAGIKIKKAFIGVGGVTLEGNISTGSTVITKVDMEITHLDVARVTENSEEALIKKISPNRKIIHTIPVEYKIDKKILYGRPIGMRGGKLEVKTLSITYMEQHLNDLIQAVEEAGIEVEDVIASPLAASLVALNRTQKIAGSVLANIGAETVSLVVFENNLPVSLKVFPIGGTDITNDIALRLKVPIEEAEQIKMGQLTGTHYSQRELEETVLARLSDIFELIEDYLKKLGKSGLLPAGIILTGGSSEIKTIEEFAKKSLKLPSKIAEINFPNAAKNTIKDSSWAVAYGLCILGLSEEKESFGIKIAKQTGTNLLSWIKQFLP
ncbi:MAG TPA: cell division protein FtsA [Candidatus Paceibacterota bacterium]|jgi:cell division protein FtsA|nr:cell division protein FtsA [Candidatus Paceibacterota bacterium]HJN62750.1 cell division protein FtsA [Candidatus Paceibacterota bacterium]|tara:strand:- start:4396 stop:5568 length:1173 start_codon:yes stop_codon:yes gene_type:complete